MAKTLDDISKQLASQADNQNQMVDKIEHIDNDFHKLLDHLKAGDRKQNAKDLEASREKLGGTSAQKTQKRNNAMFGPDIKAWQNSLNRNPIMQATGLGAAAGAAAGIASSLGKGLIKRGVGPALGFMFADEIADFLLGKEGESALRTEVEKVFNVDGALGAGALGLLIGKRFALFAGLLTGIATTPENKEQLDALAKNFKENTWPSIQETYNNLIKSIDENFNVDLPEFKEIQEKAKTIGDNLNNSLTNALKNLNAFIDSDPETNINQQGAKDLAFWGILGTQLLGLGKVLKMFGSKGKALNKILIGIGAYLGYDLATGDPLDPNNPNTPDLSLFDAAVTVTSGYVAYRGLSSMYERGRGSIYQKPPTVKPPMVPKGPSKGEEWRKNNQKLKKYKKILQKMGYTVSKDGFVLKNGKMINGEEAAKLLKKLGAGKGLLAGLLKKKAIMVPIAIGAGIVGAPLVATAATVVGIGFLVYDAYSFWQWAKDFEIPADLQLSYEEAVKKADLYSGGVTLDDGSIIYPGFNMGMNEFGGLDGNINAPNFDRMIPYWAAQPGSAPIHYSAQADLKSIYAGQSGRLNKGSPPPSIVYPYSPANDPYSEKDRGGNMAYQDNSTTVNNNNQQSIISSNIESLDQNMLQYMMRGRELYGIF